LVFARRVRSTISWPRMSCSRSSCSTPCRRGRSSAYAARAPQLERPYRTWGYPVTPIVFIAFAIWLVANTIVETPKRLPAIGAGNHSAWIAGLLLLASRRAAPGRVVDQLRQMTAEIRWPQTSPHRHRNDLRTGPPGPPSRPILTFRTRWPRPHRRLTGDASAGRWPARPCRLFPPRTTPCHRHRHRHPRRPETCASTSPARKRPPQRAR